MSFNVDIFNKQIQTSKSDYGTYSVVMTADLLPYATIDAVDNEVNTLNTNLDNLSATTALQLSSTNDSLNTRITSLSGTVDSKFLPLTGGLLTGNLTLSGADGQDKSLILYSPTVNASAELKAAITFIGFNPGTGQFESEPGVSFPRILIREGRLDLDPDTIFTRAEFRVSNVNTQFNIYNKDLAKYYLRIRPNGGFEAGGTTLSATGANSHAEGAFTVASGQQSHAEGGGTIASGNNSHAEGGNTQALGTHSHAEGVFTVAAGVFSHAAGYKATAAQDYTYAWSDGLLGTVGPNLSTTRSGQYMVSASGGMFIPGNVGIGTDDNTSALTVVGNIKGTNLNVSLNQGTATGNFSFAANDGTASGIRSFAIGDEAEAVGDTSFAQGLRTRARGLLSYASGWVSEAAHDLSWIWSGDITRSTLGPRLSTTRDGQFMVDAYGGAYFTSPVGIGTDSIANALTVVGDISATGAVYSSGAPVVVSTSTFETPTTGISAINNIVALTQATYDALTVKLPTTLYVIVSS